GRPTGGVGSENGDAALARGRERHQAAQGRGLAGAVAAEQRRDLALGDLEADAMQDVALAVEGVQALGGECGAHAALPRYAACTASLAAISFGVPSASRLPWSSTEM